MLIFKNCFDKARVRNSIKLFSDPQLCSDFSEYLQYGNTDIQHKKDHKIFRYYLNASTFSELNECFRILQAHFWEYYR